MIYFVYNPNDHSPGMRCDVCFPDVVIDNPLYVVPYSADWMGNDARNGVCSSGELSSSRTHKGDLDEYDNIILKDLQPLNRRLLQFIGDIYKLLDKRRRIPNIICTFSRYMAFSNINIMDDIMNCYDSGMHGDEVINYIKLLDRYNCEDVEHCKVISNIIFERYHDKYKVCFVDEWSELVDIIKK